MCGIYSAPLAAFIYSFSSVCFILLVIITVWTKHAKKSLVHFRPNSMITMHPNVVFWLVDLHVADQCMFFIFAGNTLSVTKVIFPSKMIKRCKCSRTITARVFVLLHVLLTATSVHWVLLLGPMMVNGVHGFHEYTSPWPSLWFAKLKWRVQLRNDS